MSAIRVRDRLFLEYTMQIPNLEEGSPAAVAGKLKKGRIIATINGQKLADIDPRIPLGNTITAAEERTYAWLETYLK